MKIPSIIIYALIGIHLAVLPSTIAVPQHTTLTDLPYELLSDITSRVTGDDPAGYLKELNAFALVCRQTEFISRPLRYGVLRARLNRLDLMTDFHKRAILEHTHSLVLSEDTKRLLFKYKVNLLAILRTTGKREHCYVL